MAATLQFIIEAENRAKTQLDALQKQMAETEKRNKAMNDAFKRMAMVGTAAFASIVASIGLSIRSYAKAGDEVQKMALRTGFATETLSELRYMAEISGTSIQGLENGVKRMARTIVEADRGMETYARAFNDLGLEVDKIMAMNPEEQFMTIAEAIAEVEDPTRRAAYAQEIFGRAGTELLPLFAEGKEGMRALAEEAHNLGLVFDQDAADQAAKFQDQMTALKGSFDGVKFAIAEAFIPILMSLLEKIEPIIVSIKDWIAENPRLVRTAVAVMLAVSGLMAAVGILGIAVLAATKAFIGLKTAMVVAKLAALKLTAIPIVALFSVIALAIMLVVKEFMKLADTVGGVGNAITAFCLYVQQLFWEMVRDIASAIDWLASKIPGISSVTGGVVDAANNKLDELNNKFLELAASGIKEVGDSAEDMVEATLNALSDLEFGTGKTLENLSDINKKYRDKLDEEDSSFYNRLAKKVAQYEIEVEQLREEATQAEKEHNNERARDLFEKANEKRRELNKFYSWDIDVSEQISLEKKKMQMGELELMYFEHLERRKLIEETRNEELRMVEEAHIKKLQMEEAERNAVRQAEADKLAATKENITGALRAYASKAAALGRDTSPFHRAIADVHGITMGAGKSLAPATPVGKVQPPSLNVYLQGGYYLSEDAAEEIGDTIIDKLKREMKL